jgi:hypothetical protein
MRFRPPLRVSSIRHEEKQQKLKDFILQHISGSPASDGPPHPILIVARSVDSPVVKAIAALEQEIAAARRTVRLILAQADHETAAVGWTHPGRPLACQHEIRWARHPRLIEAHEQLVVGPETCWIGDCMRRDPTRCDAFENYVEDCGEAAGCATVSFERLWSASEPLAVRSTASVSDNGSDVHAQTPAALQPSADLTR